ncbi:MAG: S1C family serine protease [Anaerolineae bacterium]
MHRRVPLVLVRLIAPLLWVTLAGCSTTPGPRQVSIVPPTPAPDQPAPAHLARLESQPRPTAPSPSDDTIVDGEERRFIALFQESNPSVVHIHVDREQPDSVAGQSRRRIRRGRESTGFQGWISDPNGGSGFVYDDKGHLLTTNRVVSGARSIRVTFANGTEAPAKLIGSDPNTDLAVLMVSRLPQTAHPLKLGDSDSLQVGQRVVAVGNPLGFGGAMTSGVVSAKARNVSLEISVSDGARTGFFTAPDLIQTDAAILAGCVGGPLIDLKGQVVGVLGIDTRVFDVAGRTRAGGVGLSIPTSTIARVVPVLLKEGRYPYPWLGISAMDLNPDLAQAVDLPAAQRGVLIARVTPDSPADKAGLQGGNRESPALGSNVLVGGDVIVDFEGQPIGGFDELVSLLFREGTVGETVTLTIIRDGKEIAVPVTLEERP